VELPGAQGKRPVGRTFVDSELLGTALDRRQGNEPIDLVVREGYHHLTRVLRCKPGQVLELFDGAGLAGRGTIQSITKDRLLVRLERLWSVRQPRPVTTLVCALLKAPAMDSVLRKATELGTSRVFVCATARSVPSREDKAAGKRLSRWERIAAEACLQCGRPIPPRIEFFPSWAHGLDAFEDGFRNGSQDTFQGGGQAAGDGMEPDLDATAIKALLQPGTGPSLATVLSETSVFLPMALAVGPEGGFADEELREAAERGWHSVSLGPLVLRAETAAIVASAFMAQAAGRFDDADAWRGDLDAGHEALGAGRANPGTGPGRDSVTREKGD